MPRPNYRWPYWLALIAVLWTSLSPALARVWVDAGAERVEICTSTGVVWVSAETTAEGIASRAGVGGLALAPMACDWCLLHAGAWNVPPVARPLPIVPPATGGPARALVFSPFNDGHWWRPLSHAPPLLSLRLL